MFVNFRLGYYQSCRKLLNESLTVANYYENDSWLADAYHVLADLAVHEGNTGQALQLIKKAQNVGGDELFWQVCLLLLVNNKNFIIVFLLFFLYVLFCSFF